MNDYKIVFNNFSAPNVDKYKCNKKRNKKTYSEKNVIQLIECKCITIKCY